MKKNQLTVFIGRMNPLHLGHAEILDRALRSSEVVLVLVGSASNARSLKNPFTDVERMRVINAWYTVRKKIFDYGSLHVGSIRDYPYNDQKWIQSVQEKVLNFRHEENIPNDWPTVLTGAERDASSWYLKAFGGFFKTDFLEETKIGFGLSATQIREDYFNGGNLWEYKTPQATIDFLDAFKKTTDYDLLVKEALYIKDYKKSWASAPYPPTFVTTDAVVIQSGHVLVIEREGFPGRGLLALPGGYLEQHEKLEDGVIRELKEETSIEMAPAQLRGSIKHVQVFDNPDRSPRGRIITHAYLFKLKDTLALPKVKPQKGEARVVKWLSLAEGLCRPELWFEDHHAILETMYNQ